MRKRLTLVLGGVRAGKSSYAQQLAANGGRVAFLATAEAGDREMETRILSHQASRPAGWHTLEEPVDPVSALRPQLQHYDTVLFDCLSPNPPKGWHYSSGMGDEWQRGAMVRTGLRVDGSGGGLSAVAWRPCAVCGRWQGEMAGRGRSKRHSRTGVARVCGAVG